MNPIEGFLYGLELALTPELLLAAVIAAFAGTLVGVLPGIGPIAGAAIVLPLTFAFDPAVGLIMIAGIYVGAQYGGSTTSVLLNIPADPAAIVATFDGHQMAKNGRAGAALAITAVGSFIAGTIGLVILMSTAPFVSRFAMEFGSVEFFALTAGGLIALARISGGSLGAGLLPMILGVMVATVGADGATNYDRFTFGNLDLTLGLSLAAVAVGLYGISEMLFMLEDRAGARKPITVRLRELLPSREEWRRSWAPWTRGSFLGFFFGLLPVPSAVLSTFASYQLEKSVSKHRDEIGKGAVEGLAGPEASNNSAAVGSMVPVLVLGLPFSATLAMMLSAMIVQGIQPGPLMMTQRPDVFWSVIAAMYVANLALLVLNLPLISMWVSILRTPRYFLVPVIVLLGVGGSYAVNNNMIDVRVMLLMGAVGYVLRKLDFSLASFLVGLVLGPLIERYFIRSVQVGGGEPLYFVSTPVAATVWAVVGLVLLVGLLRPIAVRRSRKIRELATMRVQDDE